MPAALEHPFDQATREYTNPPGFVLQSLRRPIEYLTVLFGHMLAHRGVAAAMVVAPSTLAADPSAT